WNDEQWLQSRNSDLNVPMSVYEVHVGSWKQGSNYATLEKELIPYLLEHGFTHVELMPVAEHPFGGSWGYQVSSYYAPSARWGNPDELRSLIDALHNAGIGVIVDWVPAHFPKDSFALGRFDGQACYEHPDPRRGEQQDWGTYVFDFGRNEVRNFLVANALYWAEEFHVDGLRVDAVASMLYLDYSRDDWIPNVHGGRENLEAVQFLQETNATLHRRHPGVLTIAEESTSWPGVTNPTDNDGLGFNLKWNMGWMNDTLEYFRHDHIHRSYHHNELTFSMVYAYSERYMLPFSHDEVVHGKGTLWTRMPGDDWNKAAGVRALFGYMFSHPGKKLMFMGCEFGQTTEWAEAYSVDWSNLDGWGHEYHHGIKRLVRDLNHTYKAHPALWSQDFTQDGFQWVKADDGNNSILGYVRYGADGSTILAVCNFAGTSQPAYGMWVPFDGEWELILNTDDAVYEGAGNELARNLTSSDNNLQLHIPANSVQWYKFR
ncbi:1,4-alpha-glucan branching protein GlgB, partial [Corynebacterium stationis]|uniref:1,4-alpha-glucan branching protein GlgB n=1 Tax=Corynebacterium stationis TaxID=1705 RepID=UPI00263B1448